VRTLRERLDGLLFERTAIANQPEALIRQELALLRDAQARDQPGSVPEGAPISPARLMRAWRPEVETEDRSPHGIHHFRGLSGAPTVTFD
jgi:hypothetical protein